MAKKKKIKLIIFPGNFLPNIGGLETHVDELTKYLSKKEKYDITIFAPNTKNGKEKEKIHNNVKVIRYPAIELVHNFPFPKVWSLKFYRLLREIYKKKYDIAMTRTRFFSNTTLGTFFAKFRFKKKRMKLVHVDHGSEFVQVESKFTNFISKIYDFTFGMLTFKLANRNIAISKASQKFVKTHFVKKNSVPIITRGVDFEIYKTNNEYQLPKKNKIVISIVSRLVKWKGVENVIKAYRKLPNEVKSKAVLIIAGNGEDYNRLQRLASDELDKNIFMPGFVKFKDAIGLLKKSDIFVHASYPGGALSNSLLQAMMCKCGIIASPNEGAKEVINERFGTGILMKGNSVEEIKKEMITLINNKNLRETYSKKANEFIIENFSWEERIRDYDQIFEEVLNE